MNSFKKIIYIMLICIAGDQLTAIPTYPTEHDLVEKAIDLIQKDDAKALDGLVRKWKWLPRYSFNPRHFSSLQKTILSDGSTLIFVARLFSKKECLEVLLSNVISADDKDTYGLTYKQIFPGDESDDEEIYLVSDDKNSEPDQEAPDRENLILPHEPSAENDLEPGFYEGVTKSCCTSVVDECGVTHTLFKGAILPVVIQPPQSLLVSI